MLGEQDISTAGRDIGTIPVRVSYDIIELFSGHLYSNPAKAIEELVVNSYDAFATHCQVVVPRDWNALDARILVWDDGESMDEDGLNNLWMIAESPKREPANLRRSEQHHRLPIGKFGIGKLASYVIGRRITHICKRERILAVTMDYSKIVKVEQERLVKSSDAEEGVGVTLHVRELGESEAQHLLHFATSGDLPNGVTLPLFGENAPPTWTLVILDSLKPAATRIKMAELHWIISTALPLVSDFEVSVNGESIEPSKINYPPLMTWQIGKDDGVAKELAYKTHSSHARDPPFDTWIEIPDVGRVSGTFVLYEDSLLGGKSERMGRSHGFFLMVRRRLINYEDPLLGVHVLSHQTFNRLRAIIHADDLDKDLVASREKISEEAREALEPYLLAKFGEARKWYEDYIAKQAEEIGIVGRLAAVPAQLTQFPLMHAIDRALHDENITPMLIRLPEKGLRAVKTIVGLELSPLDPTQPLGVLDTTTGVIRVNTNHPFYVNYYDSPNMEAIAAAEVLLETYLLESRLTGEEVSELVSKRDELLRALVRESPRSVTIIAQQLRDSVSSPAALTEACHRSFRSLGFEVVVLGGAGAPDGLASAQLGLIERKSSTRAANRSYRVIYDVEVSPIVDYRRAVSVSKLGGERRKHNAEYAALISADDARFQELSGVGEKGAPASVSVISVSDFANLVETSGTKPLSLSKLEELFRDCSSPAESHEWIEAFRSSRDTLPELREILERAYALQKANQAESPSIGAIKYYRKTLGASERDIGDWLSALSRLLPDLIHVYGEKVELLQTPDIIVTQFQRSLNKLRQKHK